jgi:CheY-like chemotaxis protein
MIGKRPRQDSNLRPRLRRAVLYPLSYGGSWQGHARTEVISLPRRPRPVSAARSLALVSPDQAVGDDEDHDVTGHLAARPRVLVVDDSDVIRTLITVNLELEGFEVITAVDGQDALEKVLEVRPDVMTIDVKMPRLDGFDTVERMRADPRTQDLKIAMVTACAQADDLRRGDEVGVDAYVTKPFDPTTLVRTVRDLVAHETA